MNWVCILLRYYCGMHLHSIFRKCKNSIKLFVCFLSFCSNLLWNRMAPKLLKQFSNKCVYKQGKLVTPVILTGRDCLSRHTYLIAINTEVLCVKVILYSTWQVRTKRMWPADKTITLLKEVHYPQTIWSRLLILPFYFRLLNSQLQEKPNHMLKSMLKYKNSL